MGILDSAAEVLGVAQEPLPYYTLRLRMEPRFGEVAPGQFVMIQSDPLDPYLRRAFSVFDVGPGNGTDAVQGSAAAGTAKRQTGKLDESGDDTPAGFGKGVWIELLGKVIGPGTLRLSRLSRSDRPAVLGPLGRGFRIPGATGSNRRSALVAGGVGSAALLLLARELVRRDVRFDFFYGGRSRRDLACGERFRRITSESSGDYLETTEDGSSGQRGLVTEPLEAGLAEGRYDFLYTCGPTPLLRRVAALSEQYQVAGQAALETPMGCGYGACIGCAVPHRARPYALCCKDGPVFDLGEVDWDRLQ